MFLHHEHRGKPFEHAAAMAGFPYVEVDCLHFRETEELQHMHEVIGTLARPRGVVLLDDLRASLTSNLEMKSENWTLATDLKWRHEEHEVEPDFWKIAASDFPFELSEGIALDGPMRSLDPAKGLLDDSILGGANATFSNAQLVLAPFRFFHRADGQSDVIYVIELKLTPIRRPLNNVCSHRGRADRYRL